MNTSPTPTAHTDPHFISLKADLEGHPRQHGYYLLKLLDISELRQAYPDPEDLAGVVMPRLDDQSWPDDADDEELWEEMEVDQAAARAHAIEGLVGGPEFGQARVTIEPAAAAAYFDRFDALFEGPKTYYSGVGFGNPDYVFSTGIAIFSPKRAGVLCVVEGD